MTAEEVPMDSGDMPVAELLSDEQVQQFVAEGYLEKVSIWIGPLEGKPLIKTDVSSDEMIGHFRFIILLATSIILGPTMMAPIPRTTQQRHLLLQRSVDLCASLRITFSIIIRSSQIELC
jgi:hypothetical protein